MYVTVMPMGRKALGNKELEFFCVCLYLFKDFLSLQLHFGYIFTFVNGKKDLNF